MQSFQALRHKDLESKVDADVDCKSLVEFIEFRNMKDMDVGGDWFGCCEGESGQPCCILREVMHGE